MFYWYLEREIGIETHQKQKGYSTWGSTVISGIFYSNLLEEAFCTFLFLKPYIRFIQWVFKHKTPFLKQEIQLDMSNSIVSLQMKSFFIAYQSLLCCHSSELVKFANKTFVSFTQTLKHIVSAARSAKLRSRLDFDLLFFKHELIEEFKNYSNTPQYYQIPSKLSKQLPSMRYCLLTTIRRSV